MGRSRSLIFIPGNNQRFLEKSRTINSDIICYDLEDSVPQEEKEIARESVKSTIQEISKINDINKERILAVRINSPTSDQTATDLKKVITPGIDAIVIPKVDDDKQIAEISKIIEKEENEKNIQSGIIKIIPSIESALGVVNAYNIAKSDQRITTLVFGIFDFLHDMKIDNQDVETITGFMYARAKVPVDARAAGIDSIDSIWQDIHDHSGLIKDLKLGKKLGYNGKCIIHPSQIEHVHSVFSPSNQDIEWAKKVVQALDSAKNSSTGAVKLEGKMIDVVHYKQARRILDSR
ncbi:HpcH/HpaI aldolase/citrate lyase family protein [Candidatus Nitrosocosmicus arcticus]|uniref:Putative citrate/ citryl-CoA lyase n=1 Tax=Candidatus Nitrosocosmicus arcticus TaxID=2035267 RepID=A0A557SXK2_9ARCH|nr:CoA ester lyase [Candidatus Nitrosocosmicus arcticus]TVP41337.1 putative citrate/ citryl-CoA lyase [Candidatus Nitrosocosmicus arcticus]